MMDVVGISVIFGQATNLIWAKIQKDTPDVCYSGVEWRKMQATHFIYVIKYTDLFMRGHHD
jgi:hypothetical protein